MNTITKSRVRGAIIGTAIGDAFGMPAEGLCPATIVNKFGVLRSMVASQRGTWADGEHKLQRGQWTDDTQLMLAIGESIVSKGYLDFNDIAKRHILCLNDPRGWGRTTLTGVGKIKAGVNWWNSSVPNGAGNGTPMKIAPLGVLLALGKITDFEARTAVINISRMTHGDPRPAIAGIIQMDAIAAAIKEGVNGLDCLWRSSPYARVLEFAHGGEGQNENLHQALDKAVNMVANKNSLSEIRDAVGADSFVIKSFPFTVAAVLKYRDDPEACLMELAAQGGDTDTTCAMAGALLGAAHGLSAFPKRWRKPLEGYKRLMEMADGFLGKKNFSELTSFNGRPRILFGKPKPNEGMP